MPAPLDVAFHNHYNDVYENKAVNIPTHSQQVKDSRQYKQNMINMMNNSNHNTKSTPRYPWPVACKNHYVKQNNVTANSTLIKPSRSIQEKRKKGSITIPKKSKVIRGTPLINSINNVHNKLTTGSFDLRPKAKIIPIGKANAIPVQPKTKVTSKPPHLFVDTGSRPKPPLRRK